jgi:hypothetical protein
MALFRYVERDAERSSPYRFFYDKPNIAQEFTV